MHDRQTIMSHIYSSQCCQHGRKRSISILLLQRPLRNIQVSTTPGVRPQSDSGGDDDGENEDEEDENDDEEEL